MLDSAKEITSFIKNKSFDDFREDRKLQLSIVHLLEIIGEAGSRVSKDIQDKYAKIPWKHITGMRNRLIHGYFDIDLRIVYTTATEDIPPLIDEIKSIIR